MTLFKNVISDVRPSTKKEIKKYFCDDERIKGKKLVSFEVQYDNIGTQMDMYTSYHNVANHYNIVAEFE